MIKNLNPSNLPTNARFIRVSGEDGVCYHVVDLSVCRAHISDLTADGYECQIVRRTAVPPCRCCYFGSNLATYQDATWLDGQDFYMADPAEPKRAEPEKKAWSNAPVCAIGKLYDGWNDLGPIALTEAGQDRLLELICDQLPDEVSLGVPNTFYAPADWAGEFDANEVLSAAQEQIMQEDGPDDAPYWEVD